MRFHLDQRVAQLMRQGLSPDEAIERARRQYGAVDDARRDIHHHANRMGRKMQLARWIEATGQDTRFAVKGLWRQKGWTTVAVLTLALGIGANSAVFSVVSNLILDPLRYPDADRVVLITRSNVKNGFQISPSPEHRRVLAAARSLSGVHGYAGDDRTVLRDGVPQAVRVNSIEPSFLSFAGARIVAGRGFAESEAEAGAPAVALLSESEWRTRYGTRPDALGSTVTVDGKVHTIVGVLADGLRLPSYSEDRAAIWVPLTPDVTSYAGPLVARLAPGISMATAQAEIQSLAKAVTGHGSHGNEEDVSGASEAGFTMEVRPPGSRGQTRESILLVSGAVALLLLIACANVAHLMLARGAARERELAIRSALGAGGGRLVRLLLTESLLLSLAGGIAALAVGAAGLRLIVMFRPEGLSDLVHASLDARVLTLTLAVSVVSGLLFGLIAGQNGLRLSAFGSLREGATTGGDRRRRRARSLLVVTEMALSAVLLVGAMLLVRTVTNLYRIDPGFDTQDLHAMSLPLPASRFNDAARDDVARRLRDAARRIPGIRDATMAWMVPPAVGVAVGTWQRYGAAEPAAESGISTMNIVLPEYFSFMAMPFTAGGTFEPGAVDRNEVVVSEALARQLWSRTDVVGERFRTGGMADQPWNTIVGVVPDAAMLSLRDRRTPAIYYPSRAGAGFDGVTLIFRAANVPTAALQALALEISPDTPPPPVRRVTDLLARSVTMQRFLMALLTLFALLAVTLSAVGLYGVIAWTVRQRSREFGIRVALGAEQREIVALVMRQGLGLTLTGLLVGSLAAVGATRMIQSMLYGVTPLDGASFAAAIAVLLGIALLACLSPTRRALRVDPAVTLRSD